MFLLIKNKYNLFWSSNIYINNGNVQIGLIGIRDRMFSKELATVNYTSPEMLQFKRYDEKIDIW